MPELSGECGRRAEEVGLVWRLVGKMNYFSGLFY